MAQIKLNDDVEEIEDGAEIKYKIEEMGVPLGCENGVCGTCEIEVISGMENLSPMTEEEKDLGMEGNRRLGCQCKLLSGTLDATY